MISYYQLYLMLCLAASISYIVESRTNKIDIFDKIKEINESLEKFPKNKREMIYNLINFGVETAPYSAFILLIFFSITPILNIWFLYSNINTIIKNLKE